MQRLCRLLTSLTCQCAALTVLALSLSGCAVQAPRESVHAPHGVDGTAVERCERLLREGGELLAEGGTLLQRNALTHDALARTRE